MRSKLIPFTLAGSLALAVGMTGCGSDKDNENLKGTKREAKGTSGEGERNSNDKSAKDLAEEAKIKGDLEHAARILSLDIANKLKEALSTTSDGRSNSADKIAKLGAGFIMAYKEWLPSTDGGVQIQEPMRDYYDKFLDKSVQKFELYGLKEDAPKASSDAIDGIKKQLKDLLVKQEGLEKYYTDKLIAIVFDSEELLVNTAALAGVGDELHALIGGENV